MGSGDTLHSMLGGLEAQLLAAAPSDQDAIARDLAAADPPADPPARPAEPPPTLPADADLALLREYVSECLDHIGSAEAALLALEANPEESEAIHTVFRAFHTIKGTSGFLGLDRIQRLAHLAENLLDRARAGAIRLRGGYADLALASCDSLKAMIQGLDGLQPGAPLPIPATYPALVENLADPEAAGTTEQAAPAPPVPRLGDLLVAEGKVTREDVETAARQQGQAPIGEALIKMGAASVADVAAALRAQKRIAEASVGDTTVRVSTDRLDSLLDLVGELVIAQSMIAQDPAVLAGSTLRLSGNVARLGQITQELQDLTMALRRVPLRPTFQKMARLVRDLARRSGKAVALVTEGEDTEIDCNMVEKLNDPLVHMMRNAVDHGVEPAEARAKQGKPETGTITLRAFQAAGHVAIQICDDGKGLDRAKITAKAVERGLAKAGRELSDAEVLALIFLPGFSTADQITDVSGRGVGMDVVKRSIEALHGRVEVASRPGHGSTFTLRLP